MRAVLVDQSGNVTQAVVLPDDWQPTDTRWQPLAGLTVVMSDIAGIGWTYAAGTFTPPPQPPAPPPIVLPPDPMTTLLALLVQKGTITQADATSVVTAVNLAALPALP